MNETTEKLIRELADKLGTTSEHLWAVMVRQATLSGVVGIVTIISWCVVLWFAYQWLKTNTTPPPKTEKDQYPRAKIYDEAAIFAWVIWVLVTIGVFIGVCVSAEQIISSLINPEFWALMRLLGKQ